MPGTEGQRWDYTYEGDQRTLLLPPLRRKRCLTGWGWLPLRPRVGEMDTLPGPPISLKVLTLQLTKALGFFGLR